MKKFLLAVVVSLFMVGNAFALSITLDDHDGNTAMVVDGGIGDFATMAGLVTYIGVLGNWNANVTTGYSSLDHAYPVLDLCSLNVTSGNTGGHLTVSVTDTYGDVSDIADGIEGFMFSVGGSTHGTVDFTANINGTELFLDWDDLMYSGFAFAGTDSIQGIPGTGAFDVTITADIYHAAGNYVNTSFDAEVAPVPEPATMLLFGTGLLGLAVTRRRLKK